MYCPMKLYLKTHVDISQNDEYQLYNEIKNLKIDIQDLLQKNMRKLNKTMNLDEIETALGQNIAAYTENNISTIKNLKLGITQEQTDEITDETYFNMKILALKAKKSHEYSGQRRNGNCRDVFSKLYVFIPNERQTT